MTGTTRLFHHYHNVSLLDTIPVRYDIDKHAMITRHDNKHDR